MPRLKITIVASFDIDLKDYPGATTVAKAAQIQQEWIDDGSSDPLDFVDGDNSIIVTVEPDALKGDS